MDQTPSLSVVMVTLNEEGSIATVVGDIRKYAPEAEILLVDSSTDNTASIAENLGCSVIRQIPPKGYGPALEIALRSAVGDVVITMDCDNTYPAAAIPTLMREIENGFDLVSASRLLRKPQGMPFTNYLANWTFAKLAVVLCGVETTDVHTGMRAYRKTLLDKLEFDANGMALPVELLIAPVQLKFRYKEIAIDYFERTGTSKLQPLQGTIWTLKRLWKFKR
ncbi:MAG TPA: glycosyltransferase family 2 protein [Drouetiella sp.]